MCVVLREQCVGGERVSHSSNTQETHIQVAEIDIETDIYNATRKYYNTGMYTKENK